MSFFQNINEYLRRVTWFEVKNIYGVSPCAATPPGIITQKVNRFGMKIAIYSVEVSFVKIFWLPIIILSIFFILFAELMDPSLVVVAVLAAGLVVLMNRGEIVEIRYFKWKTIPLWLGYIGILLREVVIANWQVARIALSVHMPIEPKIVTYESHLKGEMFLTILANSITLTPGTMSVDLEGSTFLIHCLNDDYARSLEGNRFEAMLLRIEEVHNG